MLTQSSCISVINPTWSWCIIFLDVFGFNLLIFCWGLLHLHSQETLICVCLVAQSCLTLWPTGLCSLPGSSVHVILQARILEWVPFPSPGDLPDPGIKTESPVSLALQADSLPNKPFGNFSYSSFIWFWS